MEIQSIVLGGGCFWCLDAIYRKTKGVIHITVGYAGGDIKDPTYREVCSGKTGHAEVLKIDFDPSIISLEKIFEIFFTVHDPTTLNRQGADIGTEYRSIILYQDNSQMALATKIISDLDASEAWESPIVTEVVPLEMFYPAEDYHQDYFNKNPEQTYCQLVIAPKLEKFKHVFQSF